MGTSSGKTRASFQSMIFLYVSVGFSEQKGGYPIRISNMITPRDHQSQDEVYLQIIYLFKLVSINNYHWYQNLKI